VAEGGGKELARACMRHVCRAPPPPLRPALFALRAHAAPVRSPMAFINSSGGGRTTDRDNNASSRRPGLASQPASPRRHLEPTAVPPLLSRPTSAEMLARSPSRLRHFGSFVAELCSAVLSAGPRDVLDYRGWLSLRLPPHPAPMLITNFQSYDPHLLTRHSPILVLSISNIQYPIPELLILPTPFWFLFSSSYVLLRAKGYFCATFISRSII
jgi:hypothetical protein